MLALIFKHEEGGVLANTLHNPEKKWLANTKKRVKRRHDIAVGIYDLHNNTLGVSSHGNVRSANVLLTSDGRARLFDFGLAGFRQLDSRGEICDTPINSPQKPMVRAGKKGGEDGGEGGGERGSGGEIGGGGGRSEQKGSSFRFSPLAEEIVEPPAAAAYSFSASRKTMSFTSSSRSKDVHDFGCLAFEVLTGIEDQIYVGASLDLALLPMNTPSDVKAMISSCLSVKNYRIDEAITCLKQALDAFSRTKLFFSYAWGAHNCRKPLADEIYRCLNDAGHRVWIDELDMLGKSMDMDDSMTDGVENCSIVVVLLSPDYVNSEKCRHEIRQAKKFKKPIVVCMVESGFWRDWKKADGSTIIAADSDFIELAKLTTQLYADCGDVSTLDWSIEKRDEMTAEQRRGLTHDGKAIPKLLQLIDRAKTDILEAQSRVDVFSSFDSSLSLSTSYGSGGDKKEKK